MRCLALAIAIALSNVPLARAQKLPSNVDVMLGVQAVLHTADVLTTSWDLTRGREIGAIEGNPILNPLGNQPPVLAAVSGALDVLQVIVIKRIEPKHPRWALVWSAALVGLEVWATTNNIAVAGRIHQRRVALGR